MKTRTDILIHFYVRSSFLRRSFEVLDSDFLFVFFLLLEVIGDLRYCPLLLVSLAGLLYHVAGVALPCNEAIVMVLVMRVKGNLA